MGGTAIGVTVTDDALAAFANAQAVIDFTAPAATVANQKVDAPSGTALMLGEAAAAGRGVALNDVRDSGRDGMTGARKRGDIGFTAIRGGDIVGDHDVLFAAMGEQITLRHRATDRAVFARGALKAAGRRL